MTIQPLPAGDMPAEIDRVYFEADRFLKLLNEEAEALGVSIPEAQYLDLSETVHTCPSVAVALTTNTLGIPQAEPAGIGTIDLGHVTPLWTLTLFVDIVRCAPKPSSSGTVPRSKLVDMVRQVSKDTAVILGAANRRVNDRFGNISAAVNYLAPEGTTYATRGTVGIAVH